ncbi:PHD finger protein ALFIN-like 4 [Vitis vinifera]|uniref:PHD finger protein ALFIN-LIKE n=1 Tax=Vitis vinifera TaxID=29760 RepID=A0A438E8H6_VITVI|nr:PHD finger protein ALFIN-like 4 [Vitis vinifera]
MDGGPQYNPRTVEEVFRDFKGRRAGMIKALTTMLKSSTSNAIPVRVSTSALLLDCYVLCNFWVQGSLNKLAANCINLSRFEGVSNKLVVYCPHLTVEKENLCLYGFPNELWEVNLPAEEVPPELPEPALGINFARDGMQEKDWLSLVAVHSDAWLLAVAFYFGARFGFDKADRGSGILAVDVDGHPEGGSLLSILWG